MFALRTCANIVSFLLVTKNEIGAERVPVWEASEKCSGRVRVQYATARLPLPPNLLLGALPAPLPLPPYPGAPRHRSAPIRAPRVRRVERNAGSAESRARHDRLSTRG